MPNWPLTKHHDILAQILLLALNLTINQHNISLKFTLVLSGNSVIVCIKQNIRIINQMGIEIYSNVLIQRRAMIFSTAYIILRPVQIIRTNPAESKKHFSILE